MEEQDYIVFETYLSGEMAADEIKAFEARLKTDLPFHQTFQLYKETASFLEHKFENEEASVAFKDNLQKISKRHFSQTENNQDKKRTSKTLNLFKYAIAASVVLLFGLFTFNQLSNPTYSDFSNYGTISLTVRGDNDALSHTAENAFNNKAFTKAEEAFKSLLVLDKNNAEYKLYRAIANIELNNFDVADALLKDVQKGNSVYKHTATWYLALSKLKQEDEEACLEILKTIPTDSDDYNQAQKLIKKLD